MAISALEQLRGAPHVVILGAGASVATIPNGDKFGRKISVMDGFIDKLEMRDVLENIQFESDNLEDIYSKLYEDSKYDEIRIRLEEAIRNYFIQFHLPKNPTIYDLLILSLKEKDIIATFNWDPLLVFAYSRCHSITKKLPQLLFLHGNVSVQLCINCQKWFPFIASYNCPCCGEQLQPCNLLFPIKHKNYESDPFIKNQWDKISYYLRQAYIVTIFGYSAPTTDIEAIQLFKNAWGDTANRRLEEIEIIDIKEELDLRSKWKDFIFSHHCQVHKCFFDSMIAQSPRRTTEDFYDQTIEGKWLDTPNKLIPMTSWEQVEKHFMPIVEEEL